MADGHPLDESQRFTLRTGLGERVDGSWAASTVADFEPRQNGKNDSCAARELAGLILFGERLIIHTAHEFPTANESFLRLVAVFENWDDLRKKVARIRYANGEQGIELLSGQRLKYRARTGGSGRGFAKADLVVYDEAQHLQAEHVAASGPTRLANPNSQAWYMGSGGLATSANAWRLRRRALSGERGRFAYLEHTAERVRLEAGQVVSDRPEVWDRTGWAQANPAYGRRITDEAMQGLLDELGPELFGRECMCLWDPEPGVDGGVVPIDKWNSLRVDVPSTDPVAFGVDMTWDRQWASIGWAVPGYVDVDEHQHPWAAHEDADGTGWVVERCKKLQETYQAPFWIHAKGPARPLITPLREAGILVREITSEDYPTACGEFYDAVLDGTMKHSDHPALDAAVRGAQAAGGQTSWVWDRKKGSVISPLVAVTLARWGAQQGREFWGAWS